MSRASGPILIGTHTWAAGADGVRRNAAAIASLHALSGVEIVNLQFRDRPHESPGLRTLAALPRDSNTLTGRRGPRKPVMVDLFDALASEASSRNLPYFCFTNTDILISQAAIDWIRGSDLDACIFSRRNVDGKTGEPTTIELAGYDVYAIRPEWWRRHHARFRPYIAGEGIWDEVYTSIIMCHAAAAIENRLSLVRHEAHLMIPVPSKEFGRYIQMLSAFDAGYFSIWCAYYAGMRRLREAGASAEEEADFARTTFVWNPSLTRRPIQIARNLKWRIKYAAWAYMSSETGGVIAAR
jgi:hypothetical protein